MSTIGIYLLFSTLWHPDCKLTHVGFLSMKHKNLPADFFHRMQKVTLPTSPIVLQAYIKGNTFNSRWG